MSPLSFINDGLIELSIIQGKLSILENSKVQEEGKAGGKHVYLKRFETWRASEFKFTNKTPHDKKSQKCSTEPYKTQNCAIDGENLTFKKTIKY